MISGAVLRAVAALIIVVMLGGCTAAGLDLEQRWEQIMSEQVISAQVILKPEHGEPPNGETAVTSETIERFMPSPDAVRRATTFFKGAGFEVGPVAGNNFSITADLGTFERVFRTDVRQRDDGAFETVRAGGARDLEVPLDAIPASLQEVIASVTFSPAPDFGPSNF